MNELQELNIKIENLLEERGLPEDLKLQIEKVYQEYLKFYEEEIKPVIPLQGAVDFFEEEHISALNQIKSNYKDECLKKAENLINTISSIQQQELTKEDAKTKIEDSVIDGKNQGRVEKISNIVIDSIVNSRNELFRELSNYTISQEQYEEMDEKINSIKNYAIQAIENTAIEVLNTDDREIANEVLNQCNEYLEEITKDDEKKTVKKFKEQYAVSPEQLEISKNEKKENQIKENEKDNNEPDVYLL